MAAIGYVGLGAMGGSLAANLIGTHDLRVLDRNPAALAEFEAKGAKGFVDGASLALGCEIVVLCLPRTSDVREALFGYAGLVEGLAPGSLVIDQTSGIPGETAEIAAHLAERGILMLDAPVSGGVPAAAAGKVTIIASGPDAAWAKGAPVLHALSDKVFRCSKRVGDGQALKLVNNAIGMAFRAHVLELVALGRKAGLGLAPMVDHLNADPAANFTTRNMLAGLVEGRSTTNFALALMAKDLGEAMALGLATGSALPFTAATRGLVQTGLATFGQGAKLDEIITLTGYLAGVEMRGEGSADPEFLALLGTATLAGNLIAVSECVAMGRRFGLQPAEMARILNVGSAWCAVSDLILPALAKGRLPEVSVTLGGAAGALSRLSTLSAKLGTPFFLPGIALSLVQETARLHGRGATLGVLSFGYEDHSAPG